MVEHLVSTKIAGTMGWALLHSLWEGTVIAILLAAVLLCARSPRVRYVAACVAMAALFAAFGFP